MDDRLEIFTLGGLRILRGGAPVPGLNNRKAEALLVYMASTHHPHPREVLAELLWDNRTQRQAFGNLRVVFTILRQALGDCLIITRQYAAIDPTASIWMDALQLEDCLSQLPVLGKFNSQIAPQAARALELYQGEFLSGFSITDCRGFQEWQVQESERLHRMVVDGYSELVAYDIERGEYQLGIVHATRLLALDPLMESAHRQMMLLLARCNQRKAALDQYESCQKLLKAELGVDPEAETRDLYERIHAGILEGKGVGSSAPISLQDILEIQLHNLPLQLTTFIGREDQIKGVIHRLSSSRLVTLTGSGGIGKTRLALEICNRLLPDYLHGVWLVELAALTGDDQVIPSIASALKLNPAPGRSEIEAVVDFLRNKQLLLVLDTCEHVIQACASAVLSILEHAPQVQVLATSREPLGIPGEALFHVPPLTLPDPDHPQVLEAEKQFEAVQLFVERARAVSPDFTLNTANAASVAQICSRLDGIPLALELAAAHAQFISVDQIVERLEDAFRLLVGGSRVALPRLQTLRAAIDWSYTLLSEPERLLFRRLSVLVGSWELEAAESICCDEGSSPASSPCIFHEEIFDLLSSLVRKSMVVVQSQPGAETRYRLLDTIRQYAEEKLQESGEALGFRRRHLDYFTRWAGTAEKKLHGPEQLTWIDRSEANKENFLQAFNHAMETDPPAALHLAVALRSFWIDGSHRMEGIQCLEASLNQPENVDRTVDRARALLILGDIHHPYKRNRDQILEALNICLEQGDVLGHAQAHYWLGYYAIVSLHDLTIAKQYIDEGLRLFQAIGDRWWEARIYRCYQELYEASGDISSARQVGELSYQIFHELKDEVQMAIAIMRQAYLVGEYEGNLTLGREMYERALAILVKYKDTSAVLMTSTWLACLAFWQGDFCFVQSLMSKLMEYKNYFGDTYATLEETEISGRLLAWQGMYQQAVDLIEQLLERAQENSPKDYEFYAVFVGHILVYAFANLKQFDQARKYLAYMPDHICSIFSRQWTEGLIAFYEAEVTKSIIKFREFLEFAHQKNYRLGILMGVEGCAGAFYLLGKHQQALQCLASARAYRQKIGAPVWPGDQGFHNRIQAGSSEALGEDVYQDYWRSGEAMDLDQAVKLALSG